ncbi:phage tail tape measure protein [Enterococcus gallinarum]|uniref:phage tail tape measure protein n=2 Tax=Bacteria TaxID=2 RepID=UPI0011DDD405|nr:phage tail tape measure protein [Enterococcus gallinarum]TXW62239.1 phage tail tape measure protein [Enterococcus gallinarum]
MTGATPLGNMVIKLGLDDADFGKGVANSKKQVQYLAKEMQANMKVADLAGNKLGKLGTRYDGLTQIIKAQENQVTALKKAYDGSFVDGKATDSTKRLANQLQDANGKLANYKLQLQNTAGQMARLQVETQGVTGWLKQHGDAYIKQGEKIQKFGGMVSKAGSTLTKAITLPVAAGFTVATKAASDFTTQIGEIGPLLTNGQAITAEYKQQLEQMGESSKQWAKDYGVSTTEINQGLAEVVRKGYDANQTMGVMPAILDATKASGDAFNDVMNVSTEVISQFNLKGKDYETTVQNATRVTDSLTYVANATSAGFTDLGLAMSYVGPVANSLNMSVEETAAAIGLLSDAGIGGEKAGTALRGALTRLLKPSDQNIAGFEQLGISVDAFKEGTLTLPDILDKIKTNTQGWTDAQRTSAIALAFGTESQSAMNVLVNQGGDALRNLTSETESASGATKKIADSMKDLPANKVARFKESLNVLAITFGEKLLPLVTPWIEKATDMVNSFSELDDATQNNIIKWGLMAAAAGPALKLLGGGISVIGKTRKAVGLLSNGIVELAAASAEKKALPFLAKNILGIGTAATTASGVGAAGASGAGVVGLGTAIAGLAGPIAIGVTALGAVAGAVYLGKKAYDEHQLAGAKWGTAVTEEQDKVISKSYELREKAVGYINEYADGVKGSADKAIEANNAIVDSIQATIDKEYERNKKNAEKVENESIQSSLEQQAENDKQYGEQLAEQAKKRVDRINKILSDASKNSRELSDQERSYIEANYNQLSDKQLELAGLNAEQRIAIESAYQDKLSKLTDKQLEDRANSVGKALNEEQEKYEKERAAIIEGTKNNVQRQKELLGQLDKEHRNSSESMILGLAKLRLEQGYSLEQMSSVWQQYGWTVDEVADLVNSSVDDTTKNLDMLAKGTEEADIQWNQLALDPKTGEVRTNMADVLKDMASTDEGWEQLKFMAKNADISTNAKEEIAIAMGESGKWNNLYLTDKKLLVGNDEAMLNLYDTIEEMGLWNAYNSDRKTLGVDNTDALYKLLDTKGKLSDWNALPPEVKTLIADNPAKLTVEQTQSALEKYNKLSPELKKLFGDNTSVVNNINTAQSKIRNYNETSVGAKHLHATADYSEVERAKNAIAQVYSKNVVIDVEYRGRRTGQTAIPNAKGTNYHPGGDMIVNDQSGPLYKELVQFPGQAPFIPQGRNVYIPNAPAGTKVARASVTKSIMRRLGIPKYADGAGISEDSSLVRNLRSLTPSTESSSINVRTQDYSEQFEMLIDIMSNFSEDLRNMKVILDGRNVTKSVETRQINQQIKNDIKAGRRTR